MDLSRSSSCPDVNVGIEKRIIKLSVKALENQIQTFQTDRQAKVNKIKAAIKKIKELMQNEDNAPSVQSHLANLSVLLEDASQLHEAVIQLLPQEEQEKQNTWFSSILKHNSGFIDNVRGWLSDASRQSNQSAAQMSTDDVLTSPQLHPPYIEPFDVKTNGNDLSKHSENGAGIAVTVDDVEPRDSISNVASRTSRKRSSAGSKSCVSSTSSARIKAEADMAALLARQSLLKDKHALEEQEELLRKKERAA